MHELELEVYRYNGFSIDQSVFALGTHQNSIGHFSRDTGVVIGKLRDIETEIIYAVKGKPYNMDGAIARIDGDPTQESASPSLRFYKGADQKRREYVFNRLVEQGLIDKEPITTLTVREPAAAVVS